MFRRGKLEESSVAFLIALNFHQEERNDSVKQKLSNLVCGETAICETISRKNGCLLCLLFFFMHRHVTWMKRPNLFVSYA